MGGQPGTPTFSASSSLPPDPDYPPDPGHPSLSLEHSARGRVQMGSDSANSRRVIPVGGEDGERATGSSGEWSLWGHLGPIHSQVALAAASETRLRAQRTPEVSDWVSGNKVQATPFWMVPVLSTTLPSCALFSAWALSWDSDGG